MATPNLNELILKYRRRVNDMTKKDGTFYSLTDLTLTGSLYSGMDETDSNGVVEANAGAQTNQEIADLATDSTNMFLDALAKTIDEGKPRHFPTYSEMSKYVPEYMASKAEAVTLSQSNNQISGRLYVTFDSAVPNQELELLPADYYGYPVSATIESDHFTAEKEVIVHLVDQHYKSIAVDYQYDELLEDPVCYLTSNGTNITLKVEWFPSGLGLQNWPPTVIGAQLYTGTFTFFYIRRQPPAIVGTVDILLNPKHHDRVVEIMVRKHELIRELTRQ